MNQLTALRNALIDDLALARRIKQAGLPLSLSLTKSVVSIRPYRRLSDVWNMVARMNHLFARHVWRGRRSRNAL